MTSPEPNCGSLTLAFSRRSWGALGLFEELGELENVLDEGGDDFRCEGEKRAAGVAIASETNPFPLLA